MMHIHCFWSRVIDDGNDETNTLKKDKLNGMIISEPYISGYLQYIVKDDSPLLKD